MNPDITKSPIPKNIQDHRYLDVNDSYMLANRSINFIIEKFLTGITWDSFEVDKSENIETLIFKNGGSSVKELSIVHTASGFSVSAGAITLFNLLQQNGDAILQRSGDSTLIRG